MGRQDYQAPNEVLKTNIHLAIPADAVQEKCQVLCISEYMRRYAATSASSEAKIPRAIFVRRQSFTAESAEVEPKLVPVCYCRKLLNPLQVVVRCKGCGTHLHALCVETHKGKVCPVCNQRVEGETAKRQQPEGDSEKQSANVPTHNP